MCVYRTTTSLYPKSSLARDLQVVSSVKRVKLVGCHGLELLLTVDLLQAFDVIICLVLANLISDFGLLTVCGETSLLNVEGSDHSNAALLDSVLELGLYEVIKVVEGGLLVGLLGHDPFHHCSVPMCISW